MIFALIKYNIHYYINSSKYLPPLVLYAVFFAINYQMSPIGIWSNLHITAIAMFIISNWVAVSFINNENKTQQIITRLHVKNDMHYHLCKIVSIVLFLFPLYIMLILYPMLIGAYARSLQFTEFLVFIIVHTIISLLGAGIGVIFNEHFMQRNDAAIMLHLMVVLVITVPFGTIYYDNPLIVLAHSLLPPINFLAERLHYLQDGYFIFDMHFLVFCLYGLGYAVGIMGVYLFLINRVDVAN